MFGAISVLTSTREQKRLCFPNNKIEYYILRILNLNMVAQVMRVEYIQSFPTSHGGMGTIIFLGGR